MSAAPSAGRATFLSTRDSRKVWANDAPALEGDLAAGNGSETPGIQFVFGGVDTLVERLRGIVIQDRDGLLADNRAGIDAGIDEMDGATAYLDPIGLGLFPGLEPRERRQERGMDIHDAAGEGLEKLALEDAHEPGQGNQLDFGAPQGLDAGPLGLFVQFGAEFARRDESGGDIAFPRPLENAGLGHVAQDQDHLGREAARRAGPGNGQEIRAFAGTQHANPECS